MNDARQGPTTPSPRNAPPMTDRERLAALLYGSTYRDLPKPFSRFEALEMADALLAEGVTLPPQPPRPVTSAETLDAARDVLHAPMFTNPDVAVYLRYKFDSQVVPLLRRDHGLLTPEEVERRAREWAATYTQGCFPTNSLLETLLRREVPRG